LSSFQEEIIRGSLLGDGNLSPTHHGDTSLGVRFRLGHSIKQRGYLLWKKSLFENIGGTIYEDHKAIKYDMSPLPELYTMRQDMYRSGERGKYLTPDYLTKLTPLSLAIWYQDDGSLSVRNKAGTKGRVVFCVQALAPSSREALRALLKSRYDIDVRLHTVSGKARYTFDQANSDKFLALIKYYVHPSMGYKLLPAYKDRFHVEPVFDEPARTTITVPIIAIEKKPHTRSMIRFDIRVKGHHNFLADNVIVHNSPETTPGGKALKFYTSIRLDIRRIAQIKKGEEVVGGRHRVKVVKNKVAPPFRVTEFDLMYNEGVSREGELLALGEKYGMVSKSGASYSYRPSSVKAGEEEEVKLGRGYDASRTFLRENKPVASKLLKDIREKLKEQ
jgi:recombination protein RecA